MKHFASADGPIASRLLLSPWSPPTVTVSFPGTYRHMALSITQALRLREALDIGITAAARCDEGQLSGPTTIDLMAEVDRA